MADASKPKGADTVPEPPPQRAGKRPKTPPARVTSLLELAKIRNAEKERARAARSELQETAQQPPKKHKGRPKRAEAVRGFGARIRVETYDEIQRITKRDRFALGAFVERMVEVYEKQRVQEALELVGSRQPGESDDDLIKRAFRL